MIVFDNKLSKFSAVKSHSPVTNAVILSAKETAWSDMNWSSTIQMRLSSLRVKFAKRNCCPDTRTGNMWRNITVATKKISNAVSATRNSRVKRRWRATFVSMVMVKNHSNAANVMAILFRKRCYWNIWKLTKTSNLSRHYLVTSVTRFSPISRSTVTTCKSTISLWRNSNARNVRSPFW